MDVYGINCGDSYIISQLIKLSIVNMYSSFYREANVFRGKSDSSESALLASLSRGQTPDLWFYIKGFHVPCI